MKKFSLRRAIQFGQVAYSIIYISIHCLMLMKKEKWHIGCTVWDAGGRMGIFFWNNYSCIVCFKKKKEPTWKWMVIQVKLKEKHAWVQSFPCYSAIPWKNVVETTKTLEWGKRNDVKKNLDLFCRVMAIPYGSLETDEKRKF